MYLLETSPGEREEEFRRSSASPQGAVLGPVSPKKGEPCPLHKGYIGELGSRSLFQTHVEHKTIGVQNSGLPFRQIFLMMC